MKKNPIINITLSEVIDHQIDAFIFFSVINAYFFKLLLLLAPRFTLVEIFFEIN